MTNSTIEAANCPKCATTMEKRPDMFYWRGEYKPGFICVPCNALWEVPGDEIPPLRPASKGADG